MQPKISISRALFDHRLAEHGGRLSEARALFPQAPQPWIDLSTGINPKPYRVPRATLAECARLPEPQRLKELESIAARAFGSDPERVVACAGSEAALRLMPYALGSNREVRIAGPTYSSHADAWRSAGAEVISEFPAFDANAMSAGTTLTVVNPNNPDGLVLERERVLFLSRQVAARHGFLVVDEAFADVEPACSVAAEAGSAKHPNLIVLRSFGKFYGLAGLRLGFVIAAPTISSRFRRLFGDWPVSADAIVAGISAYSDAEWADRTRASLRTAARRLDALLQRSGFSIAGGTTLFRLVRSDAARDRFEQLLRAGILVRPFEHDATLLRFGLPHGTIAWRRLAEALKQPAQ